MASIKTRDKTDGTTSYIVLLRAGGARNAKQESEIFGDPGDAERFKSSVNGHGQQRPPGWVRGQGFIADQRRPGTVRGARARLRRPAHRNSGRYAQ
ncbi:hypothetical protein GCM10015535_18280 [Streptomyces gelaticus]|uniref:Uncharacterized protein n=1 Tax=Streptomyces gelaticus TaxID=285446 RepID=A0ABQ2VXD1_9ACTN|nr:hypothetical protein GCM10015535_18280 [Streptomyces gelaticus]